MTKIIMNPPYDGSLHLKILSNMIETFPEAEIVNLSPIRWLQDPLAEYKKNTDWKKYQNIREKITNLEVVTAEEANRLFNICLYADLGVYHITNIGGRDLTNFWKENRTKAEVLMIEKLLEMSDNLESHTESQCKDGIRVPLTNIGGNRGYKPTYKELDWVIDGKKNGKDWTKCKNMGGYEKPEGCPLPLSVKFSTTEEAANFYNVFYTKFGAWLCNISHSQQNIQFRLLPWLGDYSHPWTDEMLYEYFGLTDEEIRMILLSTSNSSS